MFGISPHCQIYVKHVSTSTKNLRSGTDTEYYTLLVDAFDSGGSTGEVLSSAKRMYHIRGITGLKPPVFDIDGIMFRQPENSVGAVAGQASASTNDYSHWNIAVLRPSCL